MTSKLALLASITALLCATGSSAETSLTLDIAFGVRYVPPSHVTVPKGERVTMTAPALSETAQWHRNNQPIPGAIERTLVIDAAATSDAGSYVYTPSSPGIPERGSQTLVLNVGAQQRFLNLSTRAAIGSGSQTLIAGFVVTGASEKAVLIRAVGPSLAKFGMADFLREPVITLYDSKGELYTHDYAYATVVGGGKEAAITAATLQAGAFPLIPGKKDAVDLRPFPAGAYTVHVTSRDGSAGVTLVELYEVP